MPTKKITPSKKEKLLRQIDTIFGKLQELAWRCKEYGLEPGTRFQSAGREIREISDFITRQ